MLDEKQISTSMMKQDNTNLTHACLSATAMSYDSKWLRVENSAEQRWYEQLLREHIQTNYHSSQQFSMLRVYGHP
jgi:hypothetical protein